MVHPRFVFVAFLALSVLLADIEATKVVNEDSIWSSNKVDSLCCNDHPEFGICTNKSCNKWCLQGCTRGGFCKRKICHCYC
ncbi:Defensin-like protein 20-27 [Arabidopsis suecica]|uniref:Defensin-like protein 20-27 n=1 Tax=Arabidopsis suecica TaxID=45249 RepID=A0A8T2ECL1_ARASU|nr:Defensin-like protein 20-27 [Arabidopsis suecica]